MQLSNLTVDIVDAKFLLAMKLLAAREESQDLQDAVILIKHLGIKSTDELDLLIDAYEGSYHSTALRVSRAFAKVALRYAKQM